MNTARKAIIEGLNRESAIHRIEPERKRNADGLELVFSLPHASVRVREAVDEAVNDARTRLGILFASEARSVTSPKPSDAPIVIPKELASAFIWDLQNALGFRNIKIESTNATIEIRKGDEDEDPRGNLG